MALSSNYTILPFPDEFAVIDLASISISINKGNVWHYFLPKNWVIVSSQSTVGNIGHG